MKLFGKADVKVLIPDSSLRGIYISPKETRTVLNQTTDSAYILYALLRTFPFKEAIELSDKNLGLLLDWKETRIQANRLILEKAGLYLTKLYGTKAEGITKVFVGEDIVSMFNAGLSPEVLNPKALKKIKRKLDIHSTAELLGQITEVQAEFDNNKSEYV